MKAGLAIIAAIIIGGMTILMVRVVKAKHQCEEAVLESQLKLRIDAGAEAQRAEDLRVALGSEACLRAASWSRVILSLADKG